LPLAVSPPQILQPNRKWRGKNRGIVMTRCISIWVLLALLSVGMFAGCGVASSDDADSEELGVIGQIGKKIDFAAYSGEMRQLALLYVAFDTFHNRPPKTVKEFQDYIKKDAGKLVQWMDEGYYVVLPNIKPNSNDILVYQNKDLRGKTRWVAKGDGTIHEITEMEFQAELKKLKK
jgi:hypothetical protein